MRITSFGVAGHIAIAIFFAAFISANNFAAAAENTTYGTAGFMPTIEAGMKSCSERIGYDPDAPIGEMTLAEDERPWRACVYEVIEEKILPTTRIPDRYKALIAEDKAMTDAIQEGLLTRSQRRSRLQQLANEISAAEAAEIAASDPKLKETEAQSQTEFVQRMVYGLR